MALSIGIVGLPNVGKSTLFTALTNQGGLASDYAFASTETNVGAVPVPDARLEALAEIVNPGRIVPATVEFVDIAGLAKGANKGEGLGNKFLANVRETDAIVEVVRYFKEGQDNHIGGEVDPPRDVEVLNMELVLADAGTVEKALPRLEKDARKNKDAAAKADLAARMLEWLNELKPASGFPFSSEEERALIYDLHLISMKPILYVANISESDMKTYDTDYIDLAGNEALVISAKIEADIAELASIDPETAAEFSEELELKEGGLERLVRAAYKLLGLQSFLTAGEMEVKAWTVPIGATAPQAAGVIHSDFEKGFIKAETASFEDYIECNGEAGLRAAGKFRQEGKNYVVQDGDVMNFKFNKTT